MLDLVAGAALSPLVWVQGRWVRARTPVLPEIDQFRRLSQSAPPLLW
jgi:hypothetical protein